MSSIPPSAGAPPAPPPSANVLPHPTANREGGAGTGAGGGGSDDDLRQRVKALEDATHAAQISLAKIETRLDAALPTLATREQVQTLLSTLPTLASKEEVKDGRAALFESLNAQTWRLIAAAAGLVAATAVVVTILK